MKKYMKNKNITTLNELDPKIRTKKKTRQSYVNWTPKFGQRKKTRQSYDK